MKSFQRLFGSSRPSTPPKRRPNSSNSGKQKRLLEEDEDDDEEEEEDDDDDDDDDEMIAEIIENERWHSTGWSYRNLSKSQGEWHFQSSAGGSNSFPSPPLSDGWVYSGEW